MADESHVAPASAAASGTGGGDSAAPQQKRERRTRNPKPRGGANAGDAVADENKPAKPREHRDRRGKRNGKSQDAEAPKTQTGHEEGGETAVVATGESTKKREPKEPREKKERKPKREAVKPTDAVEPPPAPVTVAQEKQEKPETKEKKEKKEKKTTKDKAAKNGDEAAPADEEPAETVMVVEPVDWKTAAWFTGCETDLSTSYWLLSRCFSCSDVETLASEALVRRAVALQTLLGRLKTELLPVDDDDPTQAGGDTKAQWTTQQVLSEVVALLPSVSEEGDAKEKTRGVAVATLEGEVVDAATDLLLSRAGRSELVLLQQWEAHLASLMKPVKAARRSGSDKDKKTVAEAAEENDKEDEEDEEDGDENDNDEEKDDEEEETHDDAGQAAEPVTDSADIGDAAAMLPSARKGKAGSNSSIAHAKAQVTAAILFHKAYVHRSASEGPAASSSALEQWTAEIHRIYESTRVFPADESSRKGIAAQIESAFRRSPQWRRCEVLLFGSSLSKFGSKTSDLDLCLRANPHNDMEETAAKMSVRELRLRMRRTQHHERDGLPASGDNEDPVFLQETLDKSLKTVEALVNTADKQRKKTKNKSVVKQRRLETLTAHWTGLVAALQFYRDQLPHSAGQTASVSSKREAKDAAAAYHAALHKQQKQRQRDIYAAAALLGRNGCDVDLVVAHARVPVIGFTHKASGLECDLCFENYHACVNTLLLRAYADFDDRARALGIAIKYWAKQRGINDASTGHLSSYSFILLTIFFLQTKAKILPNLQNPELLRQANVTPMTLNGVDVSFCADRDQARAFHLSQHPEPSTQSVGDLLLSFFEFYVDEFDFSEMVASVRHPERLQTKSARWGGKNKLKSWRISLEDPLEMDRDLGSVLQFRCQLHILEEMKRALKLLRDGESFETRVCEAVESKKKNDKATEKKKQQQQRRGGDKAKQNRGDGRDNKSHVENGDVDKARGAGRGGRGGRGQEKQADEKHSQKPDENKKSQLNQGPVVRGRVEKQPPQAAPEDSWRRSADIKTRADGSDKKGRGRGQRGDTRGSDANPITPAP